MKVRAESFNVRRGREGGKERGREGRQGGMEGRSKGAKEDWVSGFRIQS